jgi:hypothetical protein
MVQAFEKTVVFDSALLTLVDKWKYKAQLKARLRMIGLVMQYALPVLNKPDHAKVTETIGELLKLTDSLPYQEVTAVWMKAFAM